MKCRTRNHFVDSAGCILLGRAGSAGWSGVYDLSGLGVFMTMPKGKVAVIAWSREPGWKYHKA